MVIKAWFYIRQGSRIGASNQVQFKGEQMTAYTISSMSKQLDRLHLYRYDPRNECPGYDTEQSDNEAPVLEL